MELQLHTFSTSAIYKTVISFTFQPPKQMEGSPGNLWIICCKTQDTLRRSVKANKVAYCRCPDSNRDSFAAQSLPKPQNQPNFPKAQAKLVSEVHI